MVMFYSLLKEETLTSLIKWLFFISILLSSTIANAQTFNGKQTVKDFVVEGLTASKIVETDASKQLVSSTSSVSDLVPYTGATGTVNLNTQDLVNLGSVGIGTSSPGAKLDISGTANPVLKVTRVAAGGAGIYQGARFVRNLGGNATSANGIGLYFQATNNTGAIKEAGFLGGGLSGITNGSEIGEIILSPSYASQDAYQRRDFVLQATGANSGDSNLLIAGNVGIGTTTPNAKLQVVGDARIGADTTNYTEITATGSINQKGSADFDTEGRISSASLTVTSSADNTDVSGVNTMWITTAGGDVVLGGLTGGVDGQVLYIVRKDTTNDLTLENAEGAGDQDFIMHQEADELIDAGGVVIMCDGSDWYDVSHAKHV